MSRLLDALRRHALDRPDAIAVAGAAPRLSYGQLLAEVESFAACLHGRCLGILLDNDPAWAVADLAALQRGMTCVPLPPFFSASQLRHAIGNAGIDIILTDQPARISQLAGVPATGVVRVAGRELSLVRLNANPGAAALAGVAKVTYTSGTTGAPKGVCLTREAMETVAGSLGALSGAGTADVSLSLLPLSTLLENIGGVYVPLFAGGQVYLPPLQAVGVHGAAGLDVARLLGAMHHYRPSSVILIPQMLQAMVEAGETGVLLPESLRFIAVGGAPVSEQLLRRAEALGLPLFEGYGLSEAASVVALNHPGHRRIGSVGRPLPHTTVRIASDGEILVAGSLFTGYLGEESVSPHEYWPSGDLGYLDADGFLYLTGRRKNIFITAFGRNVAPEWVEREVLAHPAVAQAAVFGEARPFNAALIVPRSRHDEAAVPAAVREANSRLPDYARIGKYLIADTPFTVENGQLTGTGRPRRAVIARHYAGSIQALYDEVA